MYNILKLLPPALVAEIMTRIYERQLTTPSGGNLSMLDDEGNLWVSPSQIDKGSLKADDIVMISKSGEITGQHQPTMEYLFHQGIYKTRKSIKAVTHAHPSGLVTLSMLVKPPDFSLIPALTNEIGPVGLSGYALPGSQALGDTVKAAFSGKTNAILMENHGVITIGKNLLHSFHRLENLEQMANIYINATRLGEMNLMPEMNYPALVKNSLGNLSFIKKHLPDEAEMKMRKSLLEFLKRGYARQLMTATSGCISVRLEGNRFLISPFEEDVRYMGTSDMVYIEQGQCERAKKPSVYWKLHEAIYRAHPGVNSIACMQPAGVGAFCISEIPFETRTIPESYLMLKTVPKVLFEDAYQHPYRISEVLSEDVHNVIVENDCFLATGSSLFQLFDRIEVAEFTARSLIQSTSLGKIRRIKDEHISELEKVFFGKA